MRRAHCELVSLDLKCLLAALLAVHLEYFRGVGAVHNPGNLWLLLWVHLVGGTHTVCTNAAT